MIDSTQASALQARVVGVTGSLFGPVGAGLRQREQQRCSSDADQDDAAASARPTAFSSTARNGGREHCDKALTAASNMAQR